jgi:Phosphotransferase enzyme family
MLSDPVEEVLSGGFTNAGLITRVGDTVRRPCRPTSAATHALLEHLERVDFDGAPRFLGIDDQGREVLSYIPGEAVIPPYPDWALTDEALVSVADLLRRYHEAVASFDGRGLAWPPPVPERFREGIVSHNDPNLDNVIFHSGRAVALIDFDLAGPGSSIWDVACAARLWAPLRHEADAPDGLRGRALTRLRIFADAYGLPAHERAHVVEAMVHAHEWCYDVVRAAVESGHETFEALWLGGGRLRAERTRTWLATHGAHMRAALSG